MTDYSLKSTPLHPQRNHVGALDTLQKDMLDALHDDQVKKQINDAKLRAVKQRVEYDDFEKLVMGAHLRPVKPRSDDLNGVSKAFDGFVMPKHEPAAVQGPMPPPKAALVETEVVPPPAKTSNEFTRVWKRQCKTPAVRKGYLKHLDPETLPMIFRTELDPAMFDAMVATLKEACLESAKAASGGEGGASSSAPSASTEPEPVDLSELDGDEPAKPPAAEEAAVAAPASSSSESSSSEENNNAELAWAAALLAGIVRLNRFDLTLDFADKKTLEALGKLCEAMEAAKMTAEAEGLRKSYKL